MAFSSATVHRSSKKARHSSGVFRDSTARYSRSAAYTVLAGSYDRLTRDVDYERWADYAQRHFAKQKRPVETGWQGMVCPPPVENIVSRRFTEVKRETEKGSAQGKQMSGSGPCRKRSKI